MAGNVEQLTIDRGWTEPESAANTDYQPKYPYNNVTQTESGHTFDMDDTPTRERIRSNHRSGTLIEMHPNDPKVQKLNQILEASRIQARRKKLGNLYGNTNLKEFIAEAFSDPDFIEHLHKMDPIFDKQESTSLFDNIKLKTYE